MKFSTVITVLSALGLAQAEHDDMSIIARQMPKMGKGKASATSSASSMVTSMPKSPKAAKGGMGGMKGGHSHGRRDLEIVARQMPKMGKGKATSSAGAAMPTAMPKSGGMKGGMKGGHSHGRRWDLAAVVARQMPKMGKGKGGASTTSAAGSMATGMPKSPKASKGGMGGMKGGHSHGRRDMNLIARQMPKMGKGKASATSSSGAAMATGMPKTPKGGKGGMKGGHSHGRRDMKIVARQMPKMGKGKATATSSQAASSPMATCMPKAGHSHGRRMC